MINAQVGFCYPIVWDETLSVLLDYFNQCTETKTTQKVYASKYDCGKIILMGWKETREEKVCCYISYIFKMNNDNCNVHGTTIQYYYNMLSGPSLFILYVRKH
jgi:hypothetical protein